MFGINKSIKTFLTSNLCFWLKYKSDINNIYFSSKKTKLICLNQKINIHCLQYKQKQSKAALGKYVGGFWCEMTTGDGPFHWKKHLIMGILVKSDSLKLKQI